MQYTQIEMARMRRELKATENLEKKDRLALSKDLLGIENASRGMGLQSVVTLVQTIGALVLFAGLIGTTCNLQLAQEGQVTDRFTKAIDQLGSTRVDKDGKSSPNLEVRLGGIYALERLANDSPKDHAAVIEVLTTYVRENAHPVDAVVAVPSPISAPPSSAVASVNAVAGLRARTDIQAVLTVLGRRPTRESLDLRGADLREVEFKSGEFTLADLSGAYLEGAHMCGASMEQAHFVDAHMERAVFAGAFLQ